MNDEWDGLHAAVLAALEPLAQVCRGDVMTDQRDRLRARADAPNTTARDMTIADIYWPVPCYTCGGRIAPCELPPGLADLERGRFWCWPCLDDHREGHVEHPERLAGCSPDTCPQPLYTPDDIVDDEPPS